MITRPLPTEKWSTFLTSVTETVSEHFSPRVSVQRFKKKKINKMNEYAKLNKNKIPSTNKHENGVEQFKLLPDNIKR